MNLFLSVIGTILVIGVVNSAPGKSWGYLDASKNILPKDWAQTYSKCGDKAQSPINVKSDATLFDRNLGEIHIMKIGGPKDGLEKWEVENNGHSVKYTPLNTEFEWTMYPQNERFKLLQVHAHWRGSEHFVDNHKFDGEVHLVTQSVTNKEQLSVIGFMLKMVDEDSKSARPLIEQLSQIRKAEAKINSTDFRLSDVIPMHVKDFFRYTGSLTTPTCDEIVEWNVVSSPVLDLSENQLVQFQTLLDKNGDAILTNSRPIQPLGDRLVKRSFNQFGMHKAADRYLGGNKNDMHVEDCMPVDKCQARRRRVQKKHLEC